MVGIASFVKGLISPLTGLYANHQNAKAAKQDALDTREEILTQAAAADSQVAGKLALIRTQNQATTWKDEYALLVVTAPVVILMLFGLLTGVGLVDPGVTTNVANAMFAPLTSLPEWWTRMFQLGIGSALGITGIKQYLKIKNG